MKADIGIIGGSGLYKFFDKGKWVNIKTKYGKPSDQIFLFEYLGKKIAFLPRHGRKHNLPPHKINYQANIDVFKQLGVKLIISPAAVGSLQTNIKRGDFVFCNDFIDRTKKRKDTFFNGPKTVHISSADCYCDQLRKIGKKVCEKNKIKVHDKGVVVVIEGPRFSSKAESKWFTKSGWHIINMTQYPENVLAREAEICYLNISLVTDYDIGVQGIKPVSLEEVIKVFGKNIENVKKVIIDIIKEIPKDYSCNKCHNALKGAIIS
ncbi:S-methyl-5'-thioadenosine phosphorylase [Patescibacteria group bacterium]|nr:S-methyl-5'-thioadenosine phosphorylase [Patescibacteria group bacterium]